jgi:hypothetical protein
MPTGFLLHGFALLKSKERATGVRFILPMGEWEKNERIAFLAFLQLVRTSFAVKSWPA